MFDLLGDAFKMSDRIKKDTEKHREELFKKLDSIEKKLDRVLELKK